MSSSSTSITGAGRRPRREPSSVAARSSCSGPSCAVALVAAGLLAGAAAADAGQPGEAGPGPQSGDPLAYAAAVKAVVDVCRDEAPVVGQRMARTYGDWLERNPAISETLHGLSFGPDPERMKARTAAYEEMKDQSVAALRRRLEADSTAVATRCERFIEDLDAGRLDYSLNNGRPNARPDLFR